MLYGIIIIAIIILQLALQKFVGFGFLSQVTLYGISKLSLLKMVGR
jgi:hypothetical protein